jgi:flagellar motor switch protein FliG
MMTEKQPSGLRKAAILVAALDRAAADAVLDRMGPEQADRVRQAVLTLGPVDPQEQRSVIDEFLRVSPMVPREPSGIELDGSLARRLADGSYRRIDDAHAGGVAGPSRPFRFLRETQSDQIARLLANERPQTIALVLSHLSQEQAGRVLVLLAPPVQVEVVRRLVDLEETDPEVLREVERALETRLAEHVPMQRRRVAGASAVNGILQAAGQTVGRRILDNLAVHDEQLAEQFASGELSRFSPRGGASPADSLWRGERETVPLEPPSDFLSFDDLTGLSDPALATLIAAADPDLLSLALVGAPAEVIQRMLQPLSRREARSVRREMENLVPIRLSDVEAARRQLVERARELAAAGEIDLTPRGDSIGMTV